MDITRWSKSGNEEERRSAEILNAIAELKALVQSRLSPTIQDRIRSRIYGEPIRSDQLHSAASYLDPMTLPSNDRWRTRELRTPNPVTSESVKQQTIAPPEP